MRISVWSSDVCSSDLLLAVKEPRRLCRVRAGGVQDARPCSLIQDRVGVARLPVDEHSRPVVVEDMDGIRHRDVVGKQSEAEGMTALHCIGRYEMSAFADTLRNAFDAGIGIGDPDRKSTRLNSSH